MLLQLDLQRRFASTLDIVDGCFCVPLDDGATDIVMSI